MLQIVLLSFEQGSGIFVNGDGLDLVALGDFVDHVLTGDDLAEDRMFTVEMRGGKMGDEELAAVGVWAGVGH